ncbi:DUF1684 domain-containing protein [Salinimicrobium oceani]|uniref:DUF1684 domain-containing protein n=1 Tax=Salinimicrobium oceani TaxID=2722702 RepID=A0ABX1D3E2_9FLAO|nr:DUF1684 domain-containing protein [Salinimicrobium oceani]NJW53713.1 DUF1684 domain-containing protein [Salinimicrobium oceani]
MRFLTLFFLCIPLFSLAQENADPSVIVFRNKINSEFKDPEKSPLSEKERQAFSSLEFFPDNPAFRVEAEFLRTPNETPFEMPTTTERKPVYVKYGELYFSLNNREYKLNVYQSQDLNRKEEYKDYLFLPFTDLTNGNTSYAGGRYVDLKIPEGKIVMLDFNKAYNPYCAYSGKYSCPIPPKENDLELAINAGVKDYKKPSRSRAK